MNKIATTLTVMLFVITAIVSTAAADEADDFRKDIRQLTRKLLNARKTYASANARFNQLRDPLLRMEKSHPDYQKMVKEHNELYEKMPALIAAVDTARTALQNEILSFIGTGSREKVETVFKAFYRGSAKPDVSVDIAVRVGLGRISDAAAIDFMIEELGQSRSSEWRKALCEALGAKKDEKVAGALVSFLEDKDWEIVLAAARALAENRSKAAVEPMISAYERAEDGGKQGAARGMRQTLQKMTGQYMLDKAKDFRNWWEGTGKKEYGRNTTARPRELIGKGGPRSTLYGEITSKHVIFICDVSHSMSARGRVPAQPVSPGGKSDDRPETGGGVAGGRQNPKLGKQGVKPGFEGTRIDILKIELGHVILSMLPDDARFNLITYSGQVYPWKKRLTKASKTNRKAALDFVKKMLPLGRTNTYGALELAFTDKSVDTIYFLSDGAPTTGTYIGPSEILAAVRRWNQSRNVTIHAIGLIVGKYKNEQHERLKGFLKRLAGENGGECRIFEDR